jgi:APA family basic amino acid/polyamine antiporter
MKKPSLFIKKPLDTLITDAEEGQHALKKHLGAVNLVNIGIGAIIGAGIFAISGPAAGTYAGPGVAISFLIAAIICLFAGLCYAELSSMIPVSGGSYSYAYCAMGEFPAWIMAWLLTAQYLFSATTVAVSWSAYCLNVLNEFGIHLPSFLSQAPVMYSSETGWYASGAWINIPAVLIVAVVGIMISIGIKAATTFNNLMVVVKICTIVLFVILGISYIHAENWTPFIPENTGVFGHFGWSGVLRGSGLVFFAYIGFDTVATLAQESVNPQKNLPRGILGSLIICTLAYIIVALVLTGVVNYEKLNVSDPMSVALDHMGSGFGWLKLGIKFAILAGLASVALVQLMALTRVIMTVSKDRLLPHAFSKIHHKTRTPLFSTALTIVAAMVFAGLFPLRILGETVNIASLLILAIVCLGVLILRYTHPRMHRPFKVPFVPYIPLLGILCCIGQACFIPLATWLEILSWLAFGFLIYFFYGRQNSKLRREAVTAANKR